jgi:phage/plasmid-like protein (TIGR03299 family)
MAHELDITAGHVSFADSRTDAWHHLGQSVGHTMTAREALDAAHLAGWNVRKMPLQVPPQPVVSEHGVTTAAPLPVKEHFATVRTNPITGEFDVLGVVGTKYEPVQNEDSCALLDALVDEGGAHYETAGALRGGRETFVAMRLPESMSFDGKDGSNDRTDFYLAALNSHDGSSKFRFLVTPVRIVCANTQTAAIGCAKASFGIA